MYLTCKQVEKVSIDQVYEIVPKQWHDSLIVLVNRPDSKFRRISCARYEEIDNEWIKSL